MCSSRTTNKCVEEKTKRSPFFSRFFPQRSAKMQPTNISLRYVIFATFSRILHPSSYRYLLYNETRRQKRKRPFTKRDYFSYISRTTFIDTRSRSPYTTRVRGVSDGTHSRTYTVPNTTTCIQRQPYNININRLAESVRRAASNLNNTF